MISEYIQRALEKAQYKVLEDGTWFAEIPGFEGVWANAATVEECRHELMEVLEEWLVTVTWFWIGDHKSYDKFFK
jgi:predicted RNase H-like HicB family nuclease